MRNALSVILLSSAACFAPLAAASFVERQPAQRVELQQLLAAPGSYYSTRVRFRCVFVQRGTVYDPYHTQFNTEQYINLVVWDDDARLWETSVRAQPLVTLYVAKSRPIASLLNDLAKYQVIEISGEVASVYNGQPWINIHDIKPVELLGSFSENAIYHLEQAGGLARDGVHDLAEAHFAAAEPGRLPPLAQVLVAGQRARNALAAGRHQAAADLLTAAFALTADRDKQVRVEAKDRAELHHLLARAQNELAARAPAAKAAELYQQAAANGRAAIAADPTQGDLYAAYGISLAGLGRFDEARQQCAEAIRLQPNNAEVRWHLGRILDQQGRHDEAIEALKKAIDLTPKDHRVHQAIAKAYFHRAQAGGPNAAADLVTALREYEIAIRLSPNNAELLLESGVVMEAAAAAKVELADKKPATYEAAIERFAAAAQADPKLLAAHLALAKGWQALGKPEQALPSLKAAMELEPNRVEPRLALAELQASTGAKDAAYATYEQALTVSPKNADLTQRLGRLALELGKPAIAAAWFDQLVKLSPKLVAGHLDLAEALLASGNAREAQKRARIALDLATTPADKAAAGVLIERSNAILNPPKAPKAPPAKSADKPAPAAVK